MSAAADLFACMLAVAAELHLPPRVLPAIQAVEGGRVGMARMNANGTEDLGPMQVNTIWLPLLSRHTGVPKDALRDKLIHDGCFNIAVSGAILRFYLHETRGDLLAAIGNYHSHTPIRHRAYQFRVVGAALKMFGPGSAGTQRQQNPTLTQPADDQRGPQTRAIMTHSERGAGENATDYDFSPAPKIE